MADGNQSIDVSGHRDNSSGTSHPPLPRPDNRDIVCSVQEWEIEFCHKAYDIPWETFCENRRYIEVLLFKNIMDWDDSGALENLQDAKERFRAKYHGEPYEDPVLDPNLYIDEVDHNCQIDQDPDLIAELDNLSGPDLEPELGGGGMAANLMPAGWGQPYPNLVPTGWDEPDANVTPPQFTQDNTTNNFEEGGPSSYQQQQGVGDQGQAPPGTGMNLTGGGQIWTSGGGGGATRWNHGGGGGSNGGARNRGGGGGRNWVRGGRGGGRGSNWNGGGRGGYWNGGGRGNHRNQDGVQVQHQQRGGGGRNWVGRGGGGGRGGYWNGGGRGNNWNGGGRGGYWNGGGRGYHRNQDGVQVQHQQRDGGGGRNWVGGGGGGGGRGSNWNGGGRGSNWNGGGRGSNWNGGGRGYHSNQDVVQHQQRDGGGGQRQQQQHQHQGQRGRRMVWRPVQRNRAPEDDPAA